MPATRTARQMLRWTALATLLATAVALGTTPAAARDKHHKHWNYDDQYEQDDGDDDGGYYSYYEPPRVIYRERRYYYYEPAPTYYYPPPPPPPPVYYYPQPDYEPSFSFGVTLPIH